MKTTKSTIARLLTTLTFAVAAPVQAEQVIYDSFTESELNHELWRPGYANEGTVELITQTRGGDLYMRVRGIADDTTSSGNRTTIANRLFMNEDNATPVRMFQTYSRVNSADTRECADTSAAQTQARFQHVAQWFNTGTSTGSTDYTGNVYTILGFRKSVNTEIYGERVDILANVGMCSDEDCNSSVNLWFSRIGSVAVKENVLLRTAWDKTSKEFRFYMKPQGETATTQSYSYANTATDSFDPVVTPTLFPRHQLRAQVQVAECDVANSGGRRPYASIETRVYNVRVDDTAEGY